MKTTITKRILVLAATIFCITTVALAQSIPPPWSATVKASHDKINEIATYTYSFTNVSGFPNAKPPILGLRCDYFNLPLSKMKNLWDFWSPVGAMPTPRAASDCEAMFGRQIFSNNGDPNWADITPESYPEKEDPMMGNSVILDTRSYKISNGWQVLKTNPCPDGTCGMSLFYLEFLAAANAIDNVLSPVAIGQSFVFSVNLDSKDAKYLQTNYLIENEGQYRAYPITKADTTPPVITASLSQLPAKTGDNKDFVRVQLTASVKDNFDAGPEWAVSSVLRTDKPTVTGDVSKTVDMLDNQWLLKVPVGEIRKYTVNMRGEDATGNVATQAVVIELTGKPPIVTTPPPPKPKPRTICLWGNRFCFTVPFAVWN